MARLFADENFPLPVVEQLRLLGHDAVTMGDVGQSDRSVLDEVVLELALADRRALLTMNRKHFIRFHVSGREHAGIIACTFDPDFASQAARIHAEVLGRPALSGQLIRINRPQR